MYTYYRYIDVPRYIDSHLLIHDGIKFDSIVHAVSSMFSGYKEMDIFSRKKLILVKR